jgi:hypothetical protein
LAVVSLSLESYCAIRIVLAKAMLNDNDPRLRAAFNELRREMFKTDTERLIEASRVPTLVNIQAG